jgi:general secretion pathway protein G
MRQHSSFCAEDGFTLIELLVTVVIVAILASVVMPLSALSQQRVKEYELRQNLREIRTAIDAYKQAVDEGRIARSLDQSGYPPKLSALADGVIDVKSPKSKKIYFLRRIPRDPFAEGDINGESSWGVRCYDSAPDAPRAGEDIYDVYSLSDRIGLNGIPYREW